MTRSALLALLGAAALTPPIAAAPRAAVTPAPAVNVLATTDQNEVITRALRAVQTDAVRKASTLAAYRWKAVLRDSPPVEAWPSFDGMIEEFMFNYAMKAANSDANYPRVAQIYTPPRTWRGAAVPGSRWGGDNPDNAYRIIPVDGTARFRIDGKVGANPPANISYVLIGNWETSKTLAMIEQSQLVVAPDGTFSITLDPQPANGRPNHLQTRPGALMVFIRDSLSDWRQQPNALTVTRLDPPAAPPLTDTQIADKTADIALDGLPLVYWFYQFAHTPPNAIPQLTGSGANGGLLTQRGSAGMAVLADDEALVITLDPSDAAYYSVVAHDNWWRTVDYASHTSSLNNSQVTRNRDGTVTFVVAPHDPGVHNWIDTGGLHQSPLVLRTQGLSAHPAREPTIQTRVVKVAELKAVLPPETTWVTPAERAAQVAQRQAEVAARLADH
ncbi:MAG TPA: DUF1214 domain-containing protein [Novosphingobium sp.]